MVNAGTKSFRCSICGYIHIGADAPNSCPICGAVKAEFKPHEEFAQGAAATVKTSRWKCINCNYIHEGDEPPNFCPVCGVDKEKFEAAGVETQSSGAQATSVVIIGAGIAGISAAETIRSVSPESKVTAISMETEHPYYRLNLTRLIGNEISRDTLPIHPAEWYSKNNIELIRNEWVEEIGKDYKQVRLMNGKIITYEKLIITAGAHAFYPPIPGAGLEGVLTLRTTTEADEIIKLSQNGKKCVCIGGGILGIETAGAIARRGMEVTLLENYAHLMPRQLNAKAAKILETHLLSGGVKVLKNASTKEIIGNGRVSEVLLQDGTALKADLVILATGVRPNTVLARKAGIEVNNGIVVDNYLKTSYPDIYAAGDVAEHNGVLYGTWAPAQFQGKIAALNALGIATTFGGIPRSNTVKLLGLDLTSIGKFNPEDGSYVVIEKEEVNSYMEFVFHDGKLVGSILLGLAELAAHVKKAIDEGVNFTDALIDRNINNIIAKLKTI